MNRSSALKISQLRAFVATARCGNITAAALELGLSQSTVSHAIATLEADLGVVLMNRGRHGAALTTIGKDILADAEQVLRLLNAISIKANADLGLQSGAVRLASVRSVSTRLLPRVIAQFRQTYPQVQVQIIECSLYSEVEQTLGEGQADIGFTLLPIDPVLEVWDRFYDEYVVLLPPHSLADDAPLTWKTLSTLPMIITPAVAPHRHMQVVIEHLEQFGQSLNVVYEVSQDSTVIGMVQQGLGASILARLAAEPIPTEIQVRSLPVPLERAMAIALPGDRLLSRAPFAFLATLKPIFQQLGLMPPTSTLRQIP